MLYKLLKPILDLYLECISWENDKWKWGIARQMVFSRANAMQIIWVLYSFFVSTALEGGGEEH